jgi:hypothetical protein
MVQFSDVGARHLRHAVSPERRQDRALEQTSVTFRRALLDPNGDMFLIEPIGQFVDGDSPPIRVPFRGRILAVPGGGDNRDGARAGLLAGEGGDRPKADTAGAAADPILNDVPFRPLGSTRSPNPARSSSQMK